MNEEIIRFFVKTYIRKSRQERLLYELLTPKKRYNGISRFCHQADDFINPAKITIKDENPEQMPEFQKFIKEHDEECILLSCDPSLDECILPLSDAVKAAAMNTDAVIILGSDYALIYTEAMKGGRDKYLLHS